MRRWWQSGNDKEVKLILSCTSIVVQRATQTMGQTAGNFYTQAQESRKTVWLQNYYACQNSNQNTFVHLSPYSELRRNCFCTSCRYGCTEEHMCNCALQCWYLCFDFRRRRQSVCLTRLTVANSWFGKPKYKRHTRARFLNVPMMNVSSFIDKMCAQFYYILFKIFI